jgi:hypothetical protein
MARNRESLVAGKVLNSQQSSAMRRGRYLFPAASPVLDGIILLQCYLLAQDIALAVTPRAFFGVGGKVGVVRGAVIALIPGLVFGAQDAIVGGVWSSHYVEDTDGSTRTVRNAVEMDNPETTARVSEQLMIPTSCRRGIQWYSGGVED